MPLVVRVKPRARREINALAAWWAVNRVAAPGAVAADLKEALDLLAEFPGIGTKVENSRDPEARFWPLRRLGYDLYYRQKGTTLEVVAFWGSNRQGGPKV
ncbi:MAG: type II toxin-antitoxin system RelE/ParE family toxin [Rubrivivax sp.]|nr:type II toxin-antitoxin system RelE/ParE family toxin [Rubrivivax sp.]